MSDDAIRFVATVEKVQVMQADNAIRIWLDLPETALFEMARLAECKIRGVALDVVATPMPMEKNTHERDTAKSRKIHI